MRYLGIDYGTKRIGLSFADELEVAYPLPPAVQKTLHERLSFIKTIINERKIEVLVVGYPYYLNGTKGKRIEEVEAFIKVLQKSCPLPIIKVDERLTTAKVEQDLKLFKQKSLSLSTLRNQRKNGTLDSRAATVILQDLLEQNRL